MKVKRISPPGSTAVVYECTLEPVYVPADAEAYPLVDYAIPVEYIVMPSDDTEVA